MIDPVKKRLEFKEKLIIFALIWLSVFLAILAKNMIWGKETVFNYKDVVSVQNLNVGKVLNIDSKAFTVTDYSYYEYSTIGDSIYVTLRENN